MAKECRDCSNGQCDDQRYQVLFTTKFGITLSGGNCIVRERYWFVAVTGAVRGLSRQNIDLRFGSSPTTFNINCLVLQVNDSLIPLLPSDNFLDQPSSPFEAVRNGLKPFGVEYQGDCNERSFFIEIINTTNPNGTISTENIKCRCTGGDETINCTSSQGAICCIPKSLLDRLCEKV